MKLFILAAGKGERLLPLTKTTHKLLIDLGDGTNLLGRILNNAEQCKEITEIIVITGYKHKLIEKQIAKSNCKKKINTFYNPFYDVSNNLMSLWCVQSMMNSDFIITNGDNIYKKNVLNKIIRNTENKETIQLTISNKNNYDSDDMKVLFDENNNISKISKQINIEEGISESVGLVVVKGSKQINLVRNKIIELSQLEEYKNKFWLEIFNSLIENKQKIDSFEIGNYDWNEMDFHPDIELIKKSLISKII